MRRHPARTRQKRICFFCPGHVLFGDAYSAKVNMYCKKRVLVCNQMDYDMLVGIRDE